jgi:dephospho-CoA kinase
MLKVALTGGAGSGKSTVARMFRELGVAVLDADALAHAVVAPGQPAWEALRHAFGPEYFLADGALNRAALAGLVFTDAAARARLNTIVHPQVAREMARRLKELEQQGEPLVIVEIPLLFEAGLAEAYDRIIVVFVPPQTQVERLKNRDHRTEAEIRGLLNAQWPLAAKRQKADYVVDNHGDLKDTRRQVKNIWRELKNHLDKEPEKR